MNPHGRPTDAPQLETELLAHALRQVKRSYDELNWSLFRGRLAQPTLGFVEGTGTWGSWQSSLRSLSLNAALLDRGWGTLIEVLKHEMAHQFVDEVLGGAPDEGPHGATFREVCAERGIDGAASGEPAGQEFPSESPDGAVLGKIEALLSLARSDNQYEAEVAMTKARRLMLRYNLTATTRSRYGFRHLGRPTGRRMAWERALANILSDFFFVTIIIVPVYRVREKKRGSVLEACGTPANLEMAAYVHDFLVHAAHNSWKAHKREKKLTKESGKQSFLYGVMSGFADKLRAQSMDHQKEGLVWLGDPELSEYFRRRHPHVRRVSGRGSMEKSAFSEGHAAGGRIVLHRGVQGGKAEGAPRLLGSGGRS